MLLWFSFSCIQKVRKNAENQQKLSPQTINLNLATISELESLPGISEETAKKIIEYREKNGGFRRVEELLLIKRVSDKKFRELRPFIKVE
jgi:competence protein ComEA